ncbi:MAG TPA: metallophosphoesterase family protein [Spirochaetota bacterium]|nr:MAG: phosphodiesterase [Spirochaetes bacterium ADurb.BinA120]HPI13086.1 metallophosphoesterase family protein [Spirochaetota bacterium]HPO44729.1 metallophosphoesterase family protein [Spirochaetota bacterium]
MKKPGAKKAPPTRIMAIADIHGHIEMVERAGDIIREADILTVAGDITLTGRVAEAREIFGLLESYNRNILAVHGNWDDKAVEEYLHKKGIGLHARGAVINEIGFFGLGGASPTPIPTRSIYNEVEIMELLEKGIAETAGAALRVLISHAPPRGIRDKTFFYLRGGSKAIRLFIESERVDLCICGHIHEAFGAERSNDTLVVNSGAFKKGSYALIEIQSDGRISCRMEKLDGG